MENPLKFLHAGDLVYDFDGKAYPAEELMIPGRIETESILLTIPVHNGKVQEGIIDKSSTFAHSFIAKHLANKFEENPSFIGTVLELPDDSFVRLFESDFFCHSVKCKQLYAQLAANYVDTGEAGKEVRRECVRTTITQWLKEITEQKIQQDLESIQTAHATSPMHPRDSINRIAARFIGRITGGTNRDRNQSCEQLIMKSFAALPEWLQILTLDTGAYVTTAGTTNYGGLALRGHRGGIGCPAVYINPFYLNYHPKRGSNSGVIANCIHTLREELLHEFSNSIDPSLYKSWQHSAAALKERLDLNPSHPALELIRRTERYGGSLMRSDYVITSSDINSDDPSVRSEHYGKKRVNADEIITDFVDAGIYIQHRAGTDKIETQEILRKAFGDEIYNLGCTIIDNWIECAGKILERDESAKIAQEYTKKWRNAPLVHPVTLGSLRQYHSRHTPGGRTI